MASQRESWIFFSDSVIAGPGWAQMPRLGPGLIGLRLIKTWSGALVDGSGWVRAGLGLGLKPRLCLLGGIKDYSGDNPDWGVMAAKERP